MFDESSEDEDFDNSFEDWWGDGSVVGRYGDDFWLDLDDEERQRYMSFYDVDSGRIP